jgi:hypothetical protein
VGTVHTSPIPCFLLFAVAGALALGQCGVRSGEGSAPYTVDAGDEPSASPAPASAPTTSDDGLFSGSSGGCPGTCSQDSECCGGLACLPPPSGVGSGACGCLSDSGCHDPGYTVCNPNHVCVQCRTSADCMTNGWGPTCGQDGYCACATDADCTGRGGGPHCWGRLQNSRNLCGCQSSAECAQSLSGPACLPFVGTAQRCGCRDDSDCPPSTTCTPNGCVAVSPQDAGTGADADADAG